MKAKEMVDTVSPDFGVKAHKVCVLRMAGPESKANARALNATLMKAGFETLCIQFFPDNEDEYCEVESSDRLLFGRNLSESPPLSRYEFRRMFGYDLDLIDLSAHSLAGATLRPEEIMLESDWCQHLRGAAAQIHRFISKENPDVLLIPHGAEVLSRIVAEVAFQSGTRSMFWESPFLSGFHYVEPFEPHFFHGSSSVDLVSVTNSDVACGMDETALLDFLDTWKESKSSKYEQQTSQEEASAFKDWFNLTDDPLVFIPGQLQMDANVLVNLGPFADYNSFIEKIVASLPQHIRVIFKKHPFDRSKEPVFPSGHNVFHATTLSIFDAFAVSDVVLTLSSNVGFEAILTGLPVIVLGKPIYSGRGLTVDLSEADDLQFLFQTNNLPHAPREKILMFLDKLFASCLLREGDDDRLKSMIHAAQCRMRTEKLPHYGNRCREIASAAYEFDNLMRTNVPMRYALEVLSTDSLQSLEEHVGIGPLYKYMHMQEQLSSEAFMAPELDLYGYLINRWDMRAVESPLLLEFSHDPEDAMAKIRKQVRSGESVLLRFIDDERKNIVAVKQRNIKMDMKDILGSMEWNVDIFYISFCNGFVACSRQFANASHLLLTPIEETASSFSGFNVREEVLSYKPWFIPPGTFIFGSSATPVQKGYLLDLRNSHRHIVFGPFVKVPVGVWKVDFLVEFCQQYGDEQDIQAKIMKHQDINFEIYNVDLDSIVGMCNSISQIKPICIVFKSELGGKIEFRVFNKSSRADTLLFSGVVLTKVDEESFVVE